MSFFPALQDCDGTVFLLHVEAEDGQLRAAMLVSEPYMNESWLKMSNIPALQGEVFEVQMPVDIIGKPERYKGYDLTLPYRQKHE